MFSLTKTYWCFRLQCVGQELTDTYASCRFGSFKRSWTLPEDVDLSSINARVEKGVLTLTLHRVKPVEPEITTINID